MFSGSFFSNEGIPEWMTAVVMIVLVLGYIYYRWTLHKSGKREDANIWSANSTISGIKNSQTDNRKLKEERKDT